MFFQKKSAKALGSPQTNKRAPNGCIETLRATEIYKSVAKFGAYIFSGKAFDKTLAVTALEIPNLDGATQEFLYAFMNTFAVSLWRIGLSKQNQNMKLIEASEKLIYTL